MKRLILIISEICLTTLIPGQSGESIKLIELGKAYKEYWSGNEPTEKVSETITQNIPADLMEATEFIIQAITPDNNLLKKEFLTLPGDQTIRYIHIIRALKMNLYSEKQVAPDRIIDSLMNNPVARYELVNSYYEILFASVGNKNKPFNLSNFDFNLQEYSLSLKDLIAIISMFSEMFLNFRYFLFSISALILFLKSV